jgi:hypothetical protein
MEQHPDMVRARRTEQPGYDERRARRTRHVLFAGLGALAGIVVGLIAVLVLSRPRFSGSPADSAVFLFGLPPLLLVGGAVVGFLLGAAPEAEDVDAPVRDSALMDRGTAAVSTQGQLPGSSVEPVVAPPGPSSDPGRLPSQRGVNDPEAGRQPRKTSRPV